MPNINITDSRQRDAVVKAENTAIQEEVRYVDSQGSVASTYKVLKATVAHDFDTLNRRFGDDPQKLGYALIEGDPEVDMERCGVYLWGVSKVYVTSDDGIVYRIEQTEKVLDTNGEVKETRPRRRAEANVDAEIPLTWTGRKIKKEDAIRRFVFSSKLQVVHVNGLTYDFLYGMASELESEQSLMMVGGGSDGKDPLVFRRGSVPYRGFLEGRIDGEQYILLLHLSNMELKVPESARDNSESAVDVSTKDNVGKKSKTDNSQSEKKKVDTETADTQSEKTGKKNVATEEARTEKPRIEKAGPEKPGIEKAVAQKTTIETRDDVDSNDAESTDTDVSSAEKSDSDASDSGNIVASQDSVELQEVNADDLGVWLKSIRMGKYLELFVANEIDVDVLTELTDADLKDLEIPVGSRRRLLKAVEETDNLRAEVAMAVTKLSQSSIDSKPASKKKKTNKKKTEKKKRETKKADKRSR